MAKIPDRAEHQRRFAGLELAQRRQIIRAVNRGQVLEDRKLAALAIGVARRQQRFWRYAWLIGPALGLLQLTYSDPQAALLNGAVGTVTIALLSLWWFTRARKAERLNTELVEGRRTGAGATGSSRGDDEDTSSGKAGRRHLPGRHRDVTTDAESSGSERTGGPAPTALPPGERPYKPRGRKRRR